MGSFVLWGLVLVIVPCDYGIAADKVPLGIFELQNKVTGRCIEFIKANKMKYPELENKDCEKIWEAFNSSINNCNDPENGDINFIKLTNHSVERDKALFWSGLKDCQILNHVRVADTLLGYMVNNLTWNFTLDGCKPSRSFDWTNTSKNFAQSVSGTVRVRLKGGYYKNESGIFRKHEIPQFKSSVTYVHIYVVKNESIKETCNSGAQLQLFEDLKNMDVPYTCYDDITTNCTYFLDENCKTICPSNSVGFLCNNPLTFFLLGLVLYNAW